MAQTHDREGNPVEWARAKEAWKKAARPILERVAHEYHETITYGELGAEVQERAGIFTAMLVQNWVGDVAFGACRDGEPIVSSLVTDAQGLVGPGYRIAVQGIYGLPLPEDLQQHAAEERLKCYRHFRAPDLPSDGGVPSLPRQVLTKRRPTPRRAAADIPRAVCPTHNLVLPLSGQCDYCESDKR